ncbi:polysaccharide biosynthesis/export family protein [Luteolibacter flavescens]|uniref:Polysaccharide biosynthesis/export family protein n=1 Tax=Luteolibacter flavescens TaxID=1859460 RepID=A0ABT3FNW0_9BACT|nr:polysaccharide biosynthesis/export family protein [Luteolibacter flavescens]MCW1884899.1 polysaccharide biosynthesis/export family protein [Luteolibacter flavescens]
MKRLFLLLAFLFASMPGLFAQNTISAGRAIQIHIKGVPSEDSTLISGTYTVSDGGTIRMPLLTSTIRAAGLSASSLGQSIEAAYRAEKIFTTPAVNVVSNSEQDLEEILVTVGGQVQSPGPVKYYRGMTIWEAVQSAKGPTMFGAMGRVKLTRGKQVKEYDLRKPEHMNIKLEPKDNINVPQKGPLGN